MGTLIVRAVAVTAALVPLVVHASCAGLQTERAPTVVGEVTFTSSGVTSGLSSVSIPPGTTVKYIDFVGTDERGEARVAFRWRPRMGLPFTAESEPLPGGSGEWRMRIAVVYAENHQFYFKRHRARQCAVPIAAGATTTLEIADPIPRQRNDSR